MKYYRAEFDTKKNHVVRHYVRDLEAENERAARITLEEDWYNNTRHNEHMFHIEIHRLKPDEEFLYHWFVLDSSLNEQDGKQRYY